MNFFFSGALLRLVDYQRHITYPADTLASALHALFNDYPQLQAVVLRPDHVTLRATLRVALNNELVPGELSQPLLATDTVSLIPVIAGG